MFCFCLCICDYVIWFSCWRWGSLAFQEQRVICHDGSLPVWRRSANAASQHTWSQEFPSEKPLQTVVELARCERVMTTRAEFHFSWVYTFLATPRSLHIWPDQRDLLRVCNPAQMCWSSGSSTHVAYTQHFELNLGSNKAYSTVEGQRLDNSPICRKSYRNTNKIHI